MHLLLIFNRKEVEFSWKHLPRRAYICQGKNWIVGFSLLQKMSFYWWVVGPQQHVGKTSAYLSFRSTSSCSLIYKKAAGKICVFISWLHHHFPQLRSITSQAMNETSCTHWVTHWLLLRNCGYYKKKQNPKIYLRLSFM